MPRPPDLSLHPDEAPSLTAAQGFLVTLLLAIGLWVDLVVGVDLLVQW